MKDHGQSRLDRFVAERPLLQPLPVQRYELCEWKSAKVHPDCHIQVAKNLYSVPHRFVGCTVRVRLGSKLVEAFVDGESVATHPRQKGVGNVITNEQHYPEGRREVQSFHVQSALSEARTVGPYTEELVLMLTTCKHPLRYLRRVQGILRVIAPKVSLWMQLSTPRRWLSASSAFVSTTSKAASSTTLRMALDQPP